MSGDLTPAYYLVAIAGTLGSGLLAMRAYMTKQRDRWVTQGGKETSLADKLDDAIRASEAATVATTELGARIRELNVQLLALDRRLSRIEDSVFPARWPGWKQGDEPPR